MFARERASPAARAPRARRSEAARRLRHAGARLRSPGCPETFVGVPAVIACTTSSCVVFARSKTPTFRPRRSTVMRVAVSKMSWRLCEIRTTREPLLGEPVDELEHLLGLRDAERGGRLVEDDEPRVPHHGARDRDRLALAAGERRDRLADRPDRRHPRATCSVSARLRLHRRLLQPLEAVVRLAAEVHVLDDVEVVAEREILVDDLDPELRRVLRAVDRDRLAVEERSRPRPSGGCPAMHLISVDLPAPLSPTSAITSPRRTSKSTSVSAWTEPNDLVTPRSSRRGVSLTQGVSHTTGDGRRRPEGRLRRRSVDASTCSTACTSPLQTSLFFRKPRREEQLVSSPS